MVRLTSFETRNSLILALGSISLSDDGGDSSASLASHFDVLIELIEFPEEISDQYKWCSVSCLSCDNPGPGIDLSAPTEMFLAQKSFHWQMNLKKWRNCVAEFGDYL